MAYTNSSSFAKRFCAKSPFKFDTLKQAKRYSIKKAKENWKKGNTEEFQDLNKDGVIDRKDYRQTIKNIRKQKAN